MTIRKNTASPDTCGCKLAYEWDDAEPSKHTYTHFVERCAIHSAHTPAAVLAENQRKNYALAAVHEALPSHCFFEGYTWDTPHGKMLVDSDFYVKHDLANAKGVEAVKVCHKAVSYAHDENRNLVITVDGLADEHKAKVHAAVSKKFAGVSVK